MTSRFVTLLLDTWLTDASLNNCCQWVYRNINWRNILTDLADTHDTFNIQLIAINTNVGTFGTGVVDRNFSVTLGGLQWVNNNYDLGNKQFIDPIMGVFTYNATNGYVGNITMNIGQTFLFKPTSDLTLILQTPLRGYPATSNNFPRASFTFQITPVREKSNNLLEKNK